LIAKTIKAALNDLGQDVPLDWIESLAKVSLEGTGDSGVGGTATLIPAGEGTSVTLDIEGLTPGINARATMHAKTCEMPSASFSAMPNLKADAAGKSTATSSVLFHNKKIAGEFSW